MRISEVVVSSTCFFARPSSPSLAKKEREAQLLLLYARFTIFSRFSSEKADVLASPGLCVGSQVHGPAARTHRAHRSDRQRPQAVWTQEAQKTLEEEQRRLDEDTAGVWLFGVVACRDGSVLGLRTC